MRSVVLFPRCGVAEVAELLAGLGTRNGGPNEWLVEDCLYVRLVDPPYWGDWESDDLLALEVCFGERPETMIEVDVSGRVPGYEEVYRLCAAVLDAGGVASDDYSDCWTLEEIQGSARDGRKFFESAG